ncbi:MAG: hemerythrin domain-containing protein [Rhizobiaceae bacterium]
MERAHREKLRLCASLEEIADTLPAAVDRLRCLSIASELVPLLRSVHAYEERVLLPEFLLALRQSPEAILSVSRLKAEHVEDECFADELTDVLMSIGHGGDVDNPEATGFMLRGFFETLRRHIAFEREHVLPAILASARA